jgi:hypothetical protein
LENIVIDIHLPHGKLVGLKDFFLHLFTITIGLLIALSLEGWVEHVHHRHLANEAEAGLRAEIANNEHEMGHRHQQIKDQQKQMEDNLKALAVMRADPHAKRSPIRLGGGIGSFDDISWKTAQTTGAIAYMPYKDAQSFSDIYLEQNWVQQEAVLLVEEMTNSGSLLISHPDDWVPSPAQIDIETDRLGRMKLRLVIVSNELDAIDQTYKEFDAKHK